MEVKIEKLDNEGRGIAYALDKIVFIPKTLPGDHVIIEITVEKKKYLVGKVVKYLSESPLRTNSICPHSKKCGGCDFIDVDYKTSLDLKVDNVKNMLLRSNFKAPVKVFENDKNLNYRNKVSFKIKNNKIGFYENNNHRLVEVDTCYICNKSINEVLINVKRLDIKEGFVTIRTNYLNEILLIIHTQDKIDIEDLKTSNIKGIIYNDELIYKDNYFVDELSDIKYEVMYNAFFQVNPYMTAKMLETINKNLTKKDNLLDLYSGVGTFSLSAASIVEKVTGVELIKNAVTNANNNALINNIDNAKFVKGDLKNGYKIKDDVNVLLIDPPRTGIDKLVIEKVLESNIEKIIYISCNPITMIRDLKLLEEKFYLREINLYDMFSYTHHVESICVLYRK